MKRVARFTAFILGCVLTAGSTPAWAGENEMMDILIHKLVKKGVLSREDAREIKQEVAEESARMTKARAEEVKDTAKGMKGGAWLDKVKWKGDLRLRHETQKREPAVDRNRQRFRLRFGFVATPVDTLEVGVQLASGASGDPTSTNQSFSSSFDKKAIFIDQAYGKYTPWEGGSGLFSGLSLIGGKMENPLFTVSEGMVWDGDVTPEGVAVQLKAPDPVPGLDRILSVKPFLTAGAYAFSELSGDYGDPGLFVFQGGAEIALPMKMKLKTAGAYHEMTGVEGKQTSDITAASTRNTVERGYFRDDYDMVTFTNHLSLPKILGQPVSLRGDYVHNTGAKDDNGGWMAGLDVGKVTEKFGSWQTGYSYKRLESDAAFGAISDSDFGTGGTNHKGHILYASMGLNEWASVGLKYFRTDEIEGSQAHHDTFQADLQMKF
ncbi:MAG: putative porin [Candidatus Omnitrophota bacterium]|nr:putative porin [Candidatus Omnitrophota bacterium]